MGNSYSKTNNQGLLVGQISSYCLVCEEPQTNEDIGAHVLSQHHKDNLEKSSLVEEHRFDGIRKVPKGYYCEFCNNYLRSLAKVKIHIHNSQHLNAKVNKNTEQKCSQLQVLNDHVLAFGCLKVALNAWNGILNETCLICNVDIEEEKMHSMSSDHEINLIQASILEQHYHLYRKIDKSTIQCLTCNSLVPENDLPKHFDSKSHEIKLRKASDGQIVKKDISIYDINRNLGINDYFDMGDENRGGLCLLCFWDIDIGKISAHTNSEHHLKMLQLHNAALEKRKWIKMGQDAKNLNVIPLHGINEDICEQDEAETNLRVENNKNKCVKTVHMDKIIKESINNFVLNTIETKNNHDSSNKGFRTDNINTEVTKSDIENSVINTVEINPDATNEKENKSPNVDMAKPSTSKEHPTETVKEKSIEDLAQEYGIKYKAVGITTCTICNERVRGAIEDIKTHVQSSKHKKKFFKTTKISQTNYESRRMQDYHKFSISVNLVLRSFVIVNGGLCIDLFSFQCFVPDGGKIKCVLCNKVLDDKKRMQHYSTDLHKRLWGNCLVITSFEKELIREVKNGVYHCGYCNTVFTVWDQLLNHLMSRKHKMQRMTAEKAYRCHFSENVVQQMGMFMYYVQAMNNA